MADKRDIIAVNATSVINGGMLEILNQFINPKNLNPKFRYLIFTSSYIIESDDNVKQIIVNSKKWFNRIFWDYFGFRKWFTSQNIKPKHIVSLQNTAVIFNGIPQYIYIQNAIPFETYNWSLFKVEERILWFYKNIFPFFIKTSINDDSNFIVQTELMKNKLNDIIDIEKDKIIVVRPDITNIKTDNIPTKELNNVYVNIFYPASAYLYKNHSLLHKALVTLKKENINAFNRIKIYLTIEFNNSNFCNKIKDDGIEDSFVFLGYISNEEVMTYYKSCDYLIHPSLIESFGLPLIEAKHFGLPIIAINLPYVTEALLNYDKLKLIDGDDINEWSRALEGLVDDNLSFTRYDKKSEFISWGEFHKHKLN